VLSVISDCSGIPAGGSLDYLEGTAMTEHLRRLDPAIVALRAHMQRVLAGELTRVKNQHGCTATAEAVEFALRRVVRQLMHVPTARARELAAAGRQDDYTAALEALYGLNVESDSGLLPVPAAAECQVGAQAS